MMDVQWELFHEQLELPLEPITHITDQRSEGSDPGAE